MLLDLQNRQAELESALNNLSSTSGSYCLSDEDDNYSQQRLCRETGIKTRIQTKQPESNPQGSKNGERRSDSKGSDERRRTNDRRPDTRQGRSDRRENSRGRMNPVGKTNEIIPVTQIGTTGHRSVAEVLPPDGNHTVSFARNPLSHNWTKYLSQIC